MTEVPMKAIVDCQTGEQQIIPLTAEEIAELQESYARAEQQRLLEEQEAAAKQAEKEAIAAKLGLTAEELAKLFS